MYPFYEIPEFDGPTCSATPDEEREYTIYLQAQAYDRAEAIRKAELSKVCAFCKAVDLPLIRGVCEICYGYAH
jgi:hypothetical protein